MNPSSSHHSLKAVVNIFHSISVFIFSVEIVVYIIVCEEIFVIIWYIKSVCPYS